MRRIVIDHVSQISAILVLQWRRRVRISGHRISDWSTDDVTDIAVLARCSDAGGEAFDGLAHGQVPRGRRRVGAVRPIALHAERVGAGAVVDGDGVVDGHIGQIDIAVVGDDEVPRDRIADRQGVLVADDVGLGAVRVLLNIDRRIRTEVTRWVLVGDVRHGVAIVAQQGRAVIGEGCTNDIRVIAVLTELGRRGRSTGHGLVDREDPGRRGCIGAVRPIAHHTIWIISCAVVGCDDIGHGHIAEGDVAGVLNLKGPQNRIVLEHQRARASVGLETVRVLLDVDRGEDETEVVRGVSIGDVDQVDTVDALERNRCVRVSGRCVCDWCAADVGQVAVLAWFGDRRRGTGHRFVHREVPGRRRRVRAVRPIAHHTVGISSRAVVDRDTVGHDDVSEVDVAVIADRERPRDRIVDGDVVLVAHEVGLGAVRVLLDVDRRGWFAVVVRGVIVDHVRKIGAALVLERCRSIGISGHGVVHRRADDVADVAVLTRFGRRARGAGHGLTDREVPGRRCAIGAVRPVAHHTVRISSGAVVDRDSVRHGHVGQVDVAVVADDEGPVDGVTDGVRVLVSEDVGLVAVRVLLNIDRRIRAEVGRRVVVIDIADRIAVDVGQTDRAVRVCRLGIGDRRTGHG